ncbi:hypothetical protein [Cerasicoccus frondis]|uniref:hypothetical protein n=1 Tax=Cerasicoccus frondis TaxID=490090 RepID=UPI002852A682|nr:hypothetical protein [Cerasicoccus frondis]
MNTEDSAVWEWGYRDGAYFESQMLLDPSGKLIVGDLSSVTSNLKIDGSNQSIYSGYNVVTDGVSSINLGAFSTIEAGTGYNISLGIFNTIGSAFCLAIGDSNTVDAEGSVGIGAGNQISTSSRYAFAAGAYNVVDGLYAAAFGIHATASARAGVAFGQYNEAVTKNGNLPDVTYWQGGGADPGPVFEVGVGTSSSDLKNGLTVFQDGSVVLGTDDATSQVLLARAQGDISMGAFGN